MLLEGNNGLVRSSHLLREKGGILTVVVHYRRGKRWEELTP